MLASGPFVDLFLGQSNYFFESSSPLAPEKFMKNGRFFGLFFEKLIRNLIKNFCSAFFLVLASLHNSIFWRRIRFQKNLRVGRPKTFFIQSITRNNSRMYF